MPWHDYGDSSDDDDDDMAAKRKYDRLNHIWSVSDFDGEVRHMLLLVSNALIR